MASTLNTKVQIALTLDYKKTSVGGFQARDLITLANVIEYENGTGAGKANQLYRGERTINASSSETLDISGSLTNEVGDTFTIARVKLLYIIAAPSDRTATQNTNDVVVGAAAGTQWAALLGTAGTLTLKPGAHSLHVAGQADATAWVATGGSTDSLKVANSGAGTAVTYQIYIVGVSA